MFDRERRLYADQYGYARELVADVPDEEFAEEPVPGLNHPAWIIGHLTTTADFGLHVLGQKPVAPEGWGPTFAPGSVPDPNRGTYPTKAELLNAYEAGHAAFAAAAAQFDDARAAAPNPVAGLKARFPTLGDLVAHLLTTHEATHLGQLSAWRRTMGKQSISL
jgi:uncharacterized damage-inducible protein DinB